jgi:hypothetical protein
MLWEGHSEGILKWNTDIIIGTKRYEETGNGGK